MRIALGSRSWAESRELWCLWQWAGCDVYTIGHFCGRVPTHIGRCRCATTTKRLMAYLAESREYRAGRRR
jgi:hypothetical protein